MSSPFHPYGALAGASAGASLARKDRLAEMLAVRELARLEAANEADIEFKHRQLAEQTRLREAQQAETSRLNTERAEDRAEARKLVERARVQGAIRLTPKGAIVNRDQHADLTQFGDTGHLFTKHGADQHSADEHFEFSGTAEGNEAAARLEAEKARRQADLESREADRELRRYLGRLAGDRATITIQTVDSDGKPITRVLSKRDALGQTFDAAPTADERNRGASQTRALPVLGAIGELSERINTGQGVAAKIVGAAERAKAQANLNDDIAEYEAVVSGFTPLLARAVGHSGVLTEQDVQSVRKMLPAPGDSKSVRDRKIARIQSLIGTSEAPEPPSPSTTSAPGKRRIFVPGRGVVEVQ